MRTLLFSVLALAMGLVTTHPAMAQRGPVAQAITNPHHPCLTGRRICAVQSYMNTPDLVLGGRSLRGEFPINHNVTVGACRMASQNGKLLYVNGRLYGRYPGPALAGQAIRQLIRNGYCFQIRPNPRPVPRPNPRPRPIPRMDMIQSPLHPCLTGQQICQMGVYLNTHAVILGGGEFRTTQPVNRFVRVGRCSVTTQQVRNSPRRPQMDMMKLVAIDGRPVYRYASAAAAGQQLKFMIQQRQCF